LQFLYIEKLNCVLWASVGVYNYVNWEDNKSEASHRGRGGLLRHPSYRVESKTVDSKANIATVFWDVY